ncbi:MAG TPA: trypsin-like serine protease [Polyangia bacterium]
MTRNAQAATLALALALAAAAPGISGCGGDKPSDVGASSLPIQGGSDDGTHQFAVGILAQTSRGTALCSGALLAPNLVVTARHCVAAIPASGVVTCPSTQFGALTPASSFIVTTDPDVRTGATRFGVSKVIVPTAANQAAVCGNDVALLILSQNVSLPVYVTPVLSPPMTDHTVYTTNVTAIGYGVNSANDMTGTSAGIRRIKQDVPLTCISNDKTFTDCLPQLAAQVTASEFVSGDGTCEGDSGSSAYEQSNFDAGRWFSFGVLSRGGTSGAMCVGGIYSRLDAWSALIIDAAKQAATMGGYPAPTWAGSDGGAPPDAGGDAAPARDAGPPADAAVDAGKDAAAVDAAKDAAADAGKDTGAPPGSDAGLPTVDARPPADSGAPDAADAAGPTGGGGAGGQGGAGGVNQTPPAEGGCSCSSGGGGPGRAPGPASWLGLALAAALLAIARRRRPRCAARLRPARGRRACGTASGG